MKYEINIGDNFCEDIVRLHLIDTLKIIEDQIAAIKAERKQLRKRGDELPEYRFEDYRYDKKMRKAMLKVIEHYSTPSSWHEFLESRA